MRQRSRSGEARYSSPAGARGNATEKPEPQPVTEPVYVPVYPWHPFGPPYYPRVTVGLGFRYYGHPYYPRAYFGPRPFPVAPGPRYKVGPVGPVHRG